MYNMKHNDHILRKKEISQCPYYTQI